MPAITGTTAASASGGKLAAHVVSLGGLHPVLAGAQAEHAQSRPPCRCVLKPGSSGAYAASGAEAERMRTRPPLSISWKAILVS